MLRRITLAVLAALLAAPAWAEDRPTLLPTRDVDVMYQMNRPGRPQGNAPQTKMEQRLRWTASTQQLRVDPPFAGLYMLVDYRAHMLWAVRTAEKLAVRMDTGSAKLPLLPAGPTSPKLANVAFSRGGTDQVAGLSCTDWLTRDTAGDATTICLTTDGVLLRARIGDSVVLQAQQVAYGPIQPDVFQVPDGFRQVALPKALKGLIPGTAP